MPLPVHVGRSERHAIETRESFETAGPFTVRITNHGQDAHVHLRPDDDLARVARVEGDGNVYVEGGETRRVRVEATPAGDPVTGTLAVETGYGAERAGIAVTVAPPDPGPEADESLANPTGDPDGGDDAPASTGSIDGATLPEGAVPIGGMAILALAIAGLVAFTVDSPVVIAGVGAVLVGVLAAVVLLVR